MPKEKILSTIINFSLITICSLFVFKQIFTAYFFMDDFYFLHISQANNLKEFINLFQPIANIPYRPISQQIFFFTFYKLFGFNPLPFHIFIFVIHIINSWLVYKISARLLKDNWKGKLISLMYVTSAIHYMGLYSITGSYFLLGIFYFLLSFWFYLQYCLNKKTFFYILSLFSFILGIFSSEIVVVLPIVILILFFTKKIIFQLLPYLFITGLNLSINFLFAGAPKTQTFKLQLGGFPTTFRWYILRALGLPEGVKNGYAYEKIIIFSLFSILIFIILLGILANRKLLKKKFILIAKSLLWMFFGAFPFYFLPEHLNPIYFTISFLAFSFLLAIILGKRLLLLYTIIFMGLSFYSVRLLLHTHWTVQRSNLARQWLTSTPTLKLAVNNRNKLIINVPDKTTRQELGITLQESKAWQLYYQNPKLEVEYQITNLTK